MPHQLPPLVYPVAALEPFIDARTMEIHHGKHHAAYVANLNKAIAGHSALEEIPLEALLTNLDAVPDTIRTAVRNNGGGHLNHSWFWQWMAPAAGSLTGGELAKDIMATFGTVDAFKERFEASGLARFGSGWAWLILNRSGKLEITSTANQDNPLMDGAGTPILGCDVWEHAYYTDYQNDRARYLDAFWQMVNWEFAESQLR